MDRSDIRNSALKAYEAAKCVQVIVGPWLETKGLPGIFYEFKNILPHMISDLKAMAESQSLSNPEKSYQSLLSFNVHVTSIQSLLSISSPELSDTSRATAMEIMRKLNSYIFHLEHMLISLSLHCRELELSKLSSLGELGIEAYHKLSLEHRVNKSLDPSIEFEKMFDSMPNNCNMTCQCACHKFIRIQSPAFLRKIIGTFSGSVTRLSVVSCKKKGCNGRVKSFATIVHVFPPWAGLYSVYLSMDRNYSYDDRLSFSVMLRMAKFLDDDHPSWKCIAAGDLDGLEALFVSQQASPIDFDSSRNSFLHVAVREENFALCQYLYGHGADPYFQNLYSRSPADIAWDQRFSNLADSRFTDLLDPNQIALKGRGFSPVHLTVLGIRPESLETFLQLGIDKICINAVDSDQRTPLYWAVRRQDIHKAKKLLLYGANPQIGVSPLAWACKDPCKDPELLQLLIDAGADPNSSDGDGHSALHACGIYGRDERFLEALCKSGANLDSPYSGPYSQYHGITALGFAALYGQVATVEKLLKVGADPNVADREKRTSVHWAVKSSRKSSRADCLNLLWLHGANLNARDRRGLNAANLAMDMQDLESLGVLMSHRAELTHPPPSEQGTTPYAILLPLLRKRKYEVVKFLMKRMDLLQTDPATGQTVLHALAMHGNISTLVSFEDLLVHFPDTSVFPTDITQYEVNAELQENSRFDSLLYRLAERIQADTLATRPLNHKSQLVSARPMKRNRKDKDAPSSLRVNTIDKTISKDARILEQNSSGVNLARVEAPSEGTSSAINSASMGSTVFDEAIELAADPDSELSLGSWHNDNARSSKAYSEDNDSGYNSDSSDSSILSGTRQLNRVPADVFRLNLELQRLASKGVTNVDNSQSFTPHLDTKRTVEDENEIERVSLFKRTLNNGRDILIVSFIMAYALFSEGLILLRSSHQAFGRMVRDLIRPRALPGYTRITWNCWCGKDIYADFLCTNSQTLQGLKSALENHSPEQNVPANVTDVNLPMPTTAYLGGRSGTEGTFSSGHHSTQIFRDVVSSSNPQNSFAVTSPFVVPRFLELCINTGKSCQSLGEIDLTRVTTDPELFNWIRKRYKEVRDPRRHWSHYLIRPVAMQFVSFGLENKEKVHIFEKNKYPTENHVAAQTWHYWPCPLDLPLPMPSSAFIHYLYHCDENTNKGSRCHVWLDRLPKKLSESLLRSSEPLAPAFGLHIIEGLNNTAALWTLFVVLAISSGPLVGYIVMTKDVQGVTGIGGLIVTTLTLLFMAAKVSEYGDN